MHGSTLLHLFEKSIQILLSEVFSSVETDVFARCDIMPSIAKYNEGSSKMSYQFNKTGDDAF